MPYEHLEHEGDEDFSDYLVRGELKRQPIVPTEKEKLPKDKRLEKEQEAYMDWNNPLLWEGDIDG